jgi:hypothetical protein
VDHPLGADSAIEAFASPASVNAGGTVSLYVSTTAASYTFEVYRVGYYQGAGARLMYTSPSIPGSAQPAPTIDPTTRMVSCANWHDPAHISVSRNWVSGVYIVKLLSADGFMRYTPFIVRNDASTAAMLVQIPLLTYQAYNRWGGYSLYRGIAPDGSISAIYRSYAVSFDRPYDSNDGLMDFPDRDYELVIWLELNGYNLTYATDMDIDSGTTQLAQHRLLVVSGHSEYWSTAMRQRVTAARDAGTSLAFFGANDVYWHVRLQTSPLGPDRVEVCYKPGYYDDTIMDPEAAKDPSADTVRWRDPPLNNPENSLLGQMYGGAITNVASLVLDSGAQPFLAGTSLQVGASFPGLIGGEYDRVYHNGQSPATLSVLASSPVHCLPTSLCPASGMDIVNATVYSTSGAARIFDAGSFTWDWGLSDDRIVISPSGGPQVNQDLDPPALGLIGEKPAGVATSSASYANQQFQQFTANIINYLLQ